MTFPFLLIFTIRFFKKSKLINTFITHKIINQIKWQTANMHILDITF